MSTILFKRFLARPLQIAYIVPSSKALIRKVSSKLDLCRAKTIVEFGPGEGCHTREIVKRMHPDSRLLLFELDAELSKHLKKQFADDPRIEVLNVDAANLKEELGQRGIEHCDYVVSGIPFSILEIGKKRSILHAVYESLAPNADSAFVIYQCTNELKQHATMFPRIQSEYFIRNFPPMVVTVYFKQELAAHQANGHSHNGSSGQNGQNGHNGHIGRH